MVNRVLTSPYLWWFDVFPLIGYVPRPLLKVRSEEHTSELQSQSNLVCRLLLEKKHNYKTYVFVLLQLLSLHSCSKRYQPHPSTSSAISRRFTAHSVTTLRSKTHAASQVRSSLP